MPAGQTTGLLAIWTSLETPEFGEPGLLNRELKSVYCTMKANLKDLNLGLCQKPTPLSIHLVGQ